MRGKEGLELALRGVMVVVVVGHGGRGEQPVGGAEAQGDLVHHATGVGEPVGVLEEGPRAAGWRSQEVGQGGAGGRVGQQGVGGRRARGVGGAGVGQGEGVAVGRGRDVGVRSAGAKVAVPLFVTGAVMLHLGRRRDVKTPDYINTD